LRATEGMNRRTSLFAAITLLPALLVQACGNQSSDGLHVTPQPARATVAFSPIADALSLGRTVSFPVEVRNVADTFYSAIDIAYDPTILEFHGAIEGTFLNRHGADPTSFQAALQNGKPGRIIVGISRLGRIGGVSGGGTLLSLSFKAIRSGTTTLAFADPKAIRGSDHRDVPVDVWEDGVVVVR